MGAALVPSYSRIPEVGPISEPVPDPPSPPPPKPEAPTGALIIESHPVVSEEISATTSDLSETVANDDFEDVDLGSTPPSTPTQEEGVFAQTQSPSQPAFVPSAQTFSAPAVPSASAPKDKPSAEANKPRWLPGPARVGLLIAQNAQLAKTRGKVEEGAKEHIQKTNKTNKLFAAVNKTASRIMSAVGLSPKPKPEPEPKPKTTPAGEFLGYA